MSRIVFEVAIEAKDAGSMSDKAEEENITETILDGLGFPDNVSCSAKVLMRGQPETPAQLQIGVSHDSAGNVLINFGKPVSWISMPKQQAIDIAKSMLLHAGIKRVEVEFG